MQPLGEEFGISNESVKAKAISRLKTQTVRKQSRKGKRAFGRYLKFGIVSFIVIGAFAVQFMGNVFGQDRYIAPQARIENSTAVESVQPLDDVVAAGVAATVATEVDLPVTPNVINRADTLDAQVKMSSATSTSTTAVIEKPQLVAAGFKTASDITKVAAKEGDTVPSIAKQYGVSEDTIRWANNLVSDALRPGQELTILPVSGVLHTVKAGETTEAISDRYKASAEQVIVFNNLEAGGIKEGMQLIIPNGIKPIEVPVAATTTRTQTSNTTPSASFSFGSGAVFAGNRYAYGYCTWYAYNKRSAIGRPIGSNWGNATTWASLARASGFLVDRNPQPGDVFQTSGGWGGYGHVGFVERVDEDGSIFVSEMNYAGWNVVSSRTIPASQVGTYNFIH